MNQEQIIKRTVLKWGDIIGIVDHKRLEHLCTQLVKALSINQDGAFDDDKVAHETEYKLSRLLERYNGDNDTAPGLPHVLWADMENATAISYLAKQIDILRAEIHSLKSGGS